jgi:hypothetical protein
MINGPLALDLLSGYSNESRTSVQSELFEAWQYFDADEFAKRVLSGMTRRNLRVFVRQPAHFRALAHVLGVEFLDIRLLDDTGSEIDLLRLSMYSDSLRNLMIQANLVIEGLPVLRQLQQIEGLTLVMPLSEIDFLRDMRHVNSLGIYNLSEVTDFSPLLNQAKLTSLNLFQANQMRDLSGLPPLGMVKDLGLTGSNLTCGLVSLVATAPRVTVLNLQGSPWIDDLAPLADLSLRQLTLWGCENVRDLAPIVGQGQLTYLDLEGTKVSDLSALSNLRNLNTLWLRGCSEVCDLRPLENLPLRQLFIERIAPGTDLAPISKIRRLTLGIESEQEVRNLDAFEGRIEITDPSAQ